MVWKVYVGLMQADLQESEFFIDSIRQPFLKEQLDRLNRNKADRKERVKESKNMQMQPRILWIQGEKDVTLS